MPNPFERRRQGWSPPPTTSPGPDGWGPPHYSPPVWDRNIFGEPYATPTPAATATPSSSPSLWNPNQAGVDIPPIGSTERQFPSIYRSPGYFLSGNFHDTGEHVFPRVQTPTQQDPLPYARWGPNRDYIVETGATIDAGDHSMDAWWRQGDVTGDASGRAGVGGNIWGDTPQLTGGRSPSPIDDPNADWTGATPQPAGEPIVETPTDPNPSTFRGPADEPLFADITNRDMTPPPLGTSEWTTSPTERRFLPGGGPNIRTFGNNLTLGEFLNTPLATMHYGEGYPPVGGGDVRYANVTSHTAGDLPEGASNPEAERQGEIETQRLRDQGLLPPSEEQPPTGRAVSPEVRRAQPVANARGTDPGSGAFEHGGYGQGYGRGSGIHYDYGAGHYVSDNHATGAQFLNASNPNFQEGAFTSLLMASQNIGWTPNTLQDYSGFSGYGDSGWTPESVDAANTAQNQQQAGITPQQAYQNMLNTSWQWHNAGNPHAPHNAPAGWTPSPNTSFANFMSTYHGPTGQTPPPPSGHG